MILNWCFREFVLQGRTTETEYTREEDGVVVKRSKLIMLAAKVTKDDLDYMPRTYCKN